MATIAFDPRMKDGDDSMTVTLTGAVGSADITDASVAAADLAADSVGTSEIIDANVTEGKLANLAVATAKIAANAVTSAKLDPTTVQYAEVTIAAADILATGAGKLGHANGYPLVASPGATKVLELISAVLIYDYDTAAYTDGGNLTINISGGGAALTGLVSAANSIGAATDKIVMLQPLAVVGAALTKDTGLNLVSSAAFTNAGAAGVVRVKVAYRVHTHGLA